MDVRSNQPFPEQHQRKTATQDLPEAHKKANMAFENAIHTQSGYARRRQPIHQDMFCDLQNIDDEYWFCDRCQRQIPYHYTDGQKPVAFCNNPIRPQNGADIESGIIPVVSRPAFDGQVIDRRHIGEPRWGVGREMKKIFKRLRVSVPQNCSCNSKLNHLDSFSPEEVEEKMRPQVFAWLEKEAGKRALYFDEEKAEKIFLMAVRRAKRAREKFRNETDPQKLY